MNRKSFLEKLSLGSIGLSLVPSLVKSAPVPQGDGIVELSIYRPEVRRFISEILSDISNAVIFKENEFTIEVHNEDGINVRYKNLSKDHPKFWNKHYFTCIDPAYPGALMIFKFKFDEPKELYRFISGCPDMHTLRGRYVTSIVWQIHKDYICLKDNGFFHIQPDGHETYRFSQNLGTCNDKSDIVTKNIRS